MSQISLNTLRKISQGKHCNINCSTILKLCRTFKIAPYQLFDETLLKTKNKDWQETL